MDKVAIISSIKVLAGIDNTKDALLGELYDKAVVDIKVFCNDNFLGEGDVVDMPEGLISVLKDIVILYFRLIGSEGKKSEGLGDYSVAYIEDLPITIKKRLYPYRQLVVR